MVLTMINNRQRLLIKYLIRESDYKPMKYFSELVNVSVKTLSRDLKCISSFLADYNVSIETKRSKGIKLSLSSAKGLDVVNYLQANENLTKNSEKDSFNIFGKDSRRMDLLFHLLTNNNSRISFKNLGKRYFISRSSIENDLVHIEGFLNDYDLEISQNRRGITIVGIEPKIREIIVDILMFLVDSKSRYSHFKNLVMSQDVNSLLTRFTFDEIAKIFNTKTVTTIYEIIEKIEIEIKYKLDEPEYIFVLCSFLVSYYRMKNQHYIKDIEINPYINSNIIKSLSEDIINKIDIPNDFKKYEASNINNILLSTGLLNTNSSCKKSKKEIDTLLKIIDEYTFEISHVSNRDIKQSVYLKEELLNYFIPLSNRIKFKSQLRNSEVKKLKEEYLPLFITSEFLLKRIFEKYEFGQINIYEISNIMLYVQNILENLKYRFNVLVVSNCSYVITQLLITKLTNHYINWNIIDTVTYSDLKTSNYDGVDLIISTTLLNDKDLDIPYFYVDALLIEKDMEWLDISIDKLNYSRDFINNKTDLKKYFIMLIYLGIQIEFDDDYSLNLNDKDLIQSKISNYSIKVHKRNHNHL